MGRQNKYIFFTKAIVTGSSEFRVAMYLKYFLYSFPNKIKEKSTQETFLSAHAVGIIITLMNFVARNLVFFLNILFVKEAAAKDN